MNFETRYPGLKRLTYSRFVDGNSPRWEYTVKGVTHQIFIRGFGYALNNNDSYFKSIQSCILYLNTVRKVGKIVDTKSNYSCIHAQ